MNEKQANPVVLNKVREELNRSCDRLDGYTLSRLNKIRHEALERGGRKNDRTLLAPFGGLATACLLVVVFSFMNQNQPATPSDSATSNLAIEDLDILLSDDSLELYEDFEFYQWLAENESSV